MPRPDAARLAQGAAQALAVALAAACAMLCGVLAGLALGVRDEGDAAGPPRLEASDAEDGFPAVDWDYWLALNPDIVAWVTVPGTAIHQPVARASADDPDFYLSHGADRRPDPKGCPFLDADCAEGMESPNCVVYGHNWAGGRMFADFARFEDASFAAEHPTVLLQTPGEKRRLRVTCVEVAGGASGTNVTAFAGAEEFRCWYQARYQASSVKLEAPPVGDAAPRRVHTFCTCADDDARDERVLVYAADVTGV